MGRTIKALTVNDIVEINRRMVQEFGGIFFQGDHNLANPGSLDHVLEAIQGKIFGKDLYPSLIEKASAIAWRIIARHVFHDGNKRTGMETCRIFLEINGYQMRIDQEVVEVAIDIANRQISFEDFVEWVERRTEKL